MSLGTTLLVYAVLNVVFHGLFWLGYYVGRTEE